MTALSRPFFHDEQAAYDFVEARLWANGRVCPKCGVIGQSGKLSGKSTRIGVYKCYACRKPFTVKAKTGRRMVISETRIECLSGRRGRTCC